ncbi:MAG: hypothetical protein ACRENQ_10060 [Gemmatimonadaceae bacterium]
MSRTLTTALVAGGVLWGASACANHPRQPSTANSGQAAARAASPNVGNACDQKLLNAADAAAILGAPITRTATLEGDPESCAFTTAELATLTVSLRPGLGRTTVATWKSGRMPVTAKPLAGVGDDAAWAADLHEVIAERDDLLCDIQAGEGARNSPRASPDAEQRALGALCNKIFARVK